MSAEKALEALKNRDFAAARELMRQESAAGFGQQHFLIKGLAELAMKDWEAAWGTFTTATSRFPDYTLFWLNRGVAEENLGMVDAAIASHENCLKLLPTQAEAAGNLSNLYRKKKRLGEAEQMAKRALENGAAKADALNALGLARMRQGKFEEADASFRLAHEADPLNADIVTNQANLAVDRLRFEEAWPLFAKARAIENKAVTRRDEGMARLLAGDFERGWRGYEARLDVPLALRLKPACPQWRGENLKGKKLLIIAEQGFGDVIQFCRYEPYVAEADLVWALPKPLLRLLSGSLHGMVLSESDPLPVCDYYVPVMSLPFLTGHFAPEAASRYLQAPIGPSLPPGNHSKKIGLIWAGSRTHERDHERSIALTQLAPLLKLVPADFYAPFTGDALAEIGDLPVIRLDKTISDFADTATLIAQMDAVVTVDTAAAHLAGALGVPVYLLLPYCPDWRWGVSSETTPWYASMALIRQQRYGDWASVIARLSGLLESRF
ncbi:MAG: tetratricopeptide repeat protein [Alphaproteobacteria bacterium]|nr:tetratricopeptide repeat protein [Alphaproteobacteria bacterium]